jgi:hypothetical protein
MDGMNHEMIVISWSTWCVCDRLSTSGVAKMVLHVNVEDNEDPMCLYMTAENNVQDEEVNSLVSQPFCETIIALSGVNTLQI